MDHLLTIILACSLHFDDSLVQALVQKVSMANPLFVGDLATLTTYDGASSVSDAARTVDEIVARGGRPAIGLMGLPISWAARYGRAPTDLFDSCTNIAIGTAVLSAYEAECSHAAVSSRPSRRSRRIRKDNLRLCVLIKMGNELGVTGYPQGILPDLAKLESARPDPNVDPPPARSQVFPDNTDQAVLNEKPDWSNSRLYFPSPLPPAHQNPTTPGVTPARAPSPSPLDLRSSATPALQPKK